MTDATTEQEFRKKTALLFAVVGNMPPPFFVGRASACQTDREEKTKREGMKANLSGGKTVWSSLVILDPLFCVNFYTSKSVI
jgi:hypothetical protein